MDAYRVEALLRSSEPGEIDVAILGNSTAEAIFDAEALEERDLRVLKLTIGGAPALSFGMLAGPLLALEPRAVILMLGLAGVQDTGYGIAGVSYDVRAVPALFTAAEVIADPGFHLDGLVRQSHVLARHRRSMQRALLVRTGRLSWERMRLDRMRDQMTNLIAGTNPTPAWARKRAPEVEANPNTRAIELLARRVGESGAAFIAMEAPLHPMITLLAGPRLAAFRKALAALAEANGFLWLSTEELPRLGAEHFHDMHHVNEDGRRVFTEGAVEILRGAL